MPGRLFAHYRVVRRLGVGGMGEVYLAQDTQLERPVALKVMSAELAKDPEQRKRFRTEARAASGLNHPHICVIYDVGEAEDSRPFLAMEYIEGQTLDVVLRERRLKIREVVQLGIEVAEALDVAHAHGVIHRDIKPGNLMLDQRGAVKVLDFGLAKRFAADQFNAPMTSAAQTRTGILLGTPQYMSPEQALGRTLDPRTDLFSLGVVLYELLAGQRPFLGQTPLETINNIVNQPLPPLGLDNAVFSPALDQIINKCLEKEPAKRYGSARELAADLRQLKEDSERGLAAAAQERTAVVGPAPAPGNRQLAAPGQPATKTALGRKPALVGALGFLMVALLGFGGWLLFRGGGLSPPAPPADRVGPDRQKSVAVLPFVNMSGDKADEYLSDGMTEELLSELAKVKGLRVPARTSCFVFKGKTDDIQKIGQQLHVSTVLEGSLRRAGNQIRITAQLINVADGFHIWSDTYDRDMTNIFAIQSDIATRVAEALKVQLLGKGREPPADIEAYKSYLKGRYLWNRRTGESLTKAIDCFNQAIAIDPGYALAHAGLADCYQVLPGYHPTGIREAEARARAAALKALELDPGLAGPLATLASLKETYNWDWPGAEADYRRAIELDPNHPSARQWFAESLSFQGRVQEAVAQGRKALELDPLSPVINAITARVLISAGAAEEAVDLLRKQVASDPSFALAHTILGWAYVAQGRLAEAIPEYEAASRLNENTPSGELGFCYARAGRTNDAQKVLQQLTELQRRGNDVNVAMAMVHHGLRNDSQAFELLEQAVQDHSYFMQLVPVNPCWNDLLPHPRFQAILKKMNLAK